eukprot:COSAG01_NODE_29107_length_645_cov_0.780220_1_plen_82_part_00
MPGQLLVLDLDQGVEDVQVGAQPPEVGRVVAGDGAAAEGVGEPEGLLLRSLGRLRLGVDIELVQALPSQHARSCAAHRVRE